VRSRWTALAVAGVLAGLAPGAMMALLPRTLAPRQLATGFGVYYTVYYLGMAVAQPVAGFIRDRSGSPAAPVFFAAGE
jgi:MFS family permease